MGMRRGGGRWGAFFARFLGYDDRSALLLRIQSNKKKIVAPECFDKLTAASGCSISNATVEARPKGRNDRPHYQPPPAFITYTAQYNTPASQI